MHAAPAEKTGRACATARFSQHDGALSPVRLPIIVFPGGFGPASTASRSSFPVTSRRRFRCATRPAIKAPPMRFGWGDFDTVPAFPCPTEAMTAKARARICNAIRTAAVKLRVRKYHRDQSKPTCHDLFRAADRSARLYRPDRLCMNLQDCAALCDPAQDRPGHRPPSARLRINVQLHANWRASGAVFHRTAPSTGSPEAHKVLAVGKIAILCPSRHHRKAAGKYGRSPGSGAGKVVQLD